MSWIKTELDKHNAIRRAYYLVGLIVSAILIPGLLAVQVSIFFLGGYLLLPLMLVHQELRKYYACIKSELISIICLTFISMLLIFFSNHEGLKALYSAISIIVIMLLVNRSFTKMIDHIKSNK